jgi:hypothetical protein
VRQRDPSPDLELGRLLAASARRASDSRLALLAFSGLAVSVAAGLWGGPGWIFIVAVAAGAFAFGVWGIADRELSDRAAARRGVLIALRTARILAAVLGGLALALLLLSLLGLALGRLIS